MLEISSSLESDDGEYHTYDYSSIELIEVPDGGGWYAKEYDFVRELRRISDRMYRTSNALTRSLRSGKHLWQEWENGCHAF